MNSIGPYRQVTEFTARGAGDPEWCRAERDGQAFIVKKLAGPVFPLPETALPQEEREARVRRFIGREEDLKRICASLRQNDPYGLLLTPVDVLRFDCRICTVTPCVTGEIRAEETAALPERHRLALLRQLTEALRCVHRAGLVHGDLRPDCLIITRTREGGFRLWLTGFENSRRQADSPQPADEFRGDPAYAAPETGRFPGNAPEAHGPAADVFSLGLLLHLMWAGALPKCGGETAGELIARGGTPGLSPILPPVMGSLIARMLALSPQDRPTADAAVSALAGMAEMPAPGPSPKTADVRIECMTRSGRVLHAWTEKIPWGSTKTVRPPEIDGMKSESWSRKVIVQVGEDGRCKSPVVLEYRKARRAGSGTVLAGGIAALAVIAMLAGFALWVWPSMSASCAASVTPTPVPVPTRTVRVTAAPTARPTPAPTASPHEIAERAGILEIPEGRSLRLTLNKDTPVYLRFTPAMDGVYETTVTGTWRDARVELIRCDADWRETGSIVLAPGGNRIRPETLRAGEAYCLIIRSDGPEPAEITLSVDLPPL